MPETGWLGPSKSGWWARTASLFGRHTLATTHSFQRALDTSVRSRKKAERGTLWAGCSSCSPPSSAPIVKAPPGTRSMSGGAGGSARGGGGGGGGGRGGGRGRGRGGIGAGAGGRENEGEKSGAHAFGK